MEEITITIDPQGNVQVEAHGIVGHDCKALTATIEGALGTAEKTRIKPEYHRQKLVTRKVGA